MATKSKRKSTGPDVSKKQVTLSKFFTSSQGKKANAKVTDDAENTFLVTELEDEPARKKCKTSNGTSSKSSTVNQNQDVDRKIQTNNPQTTEKLSKFCFDEDDVNKNDRKIRKSQNVHQVSLNDTNIETSTIAIGSDNENDVGSENTSYKSCRSSQSPLTSFSKPGVSKIKSTAKLKYTPLEQQFVDIKAQNPDVVLFVECGYKYRFFGDDAEIAAKVLKIYCHVDHNFMTASIPVHRLFVHVRRIVAAGYKVGVVKQTETAHLKAAGDNKTGPFTRKLTALYTKATLIGDDVDPLVNSGDSDVPLDPSSSLRPNTYMMCVYEGTVPVDRKRRRIGIMCVDPATGDVVYDSFEDSASYEQLETVISHFKPVEVLLSTNASEKFEKIVLDTASLSSTADDRIRIEKLKEEHFVHPQAYTSVSEFFHQIPVSQAQTILTLDKSIISCLAAVIHYLKEFSLEKILLETCNFSQFSPKSCYMQLSSNSLQTLEIFANASDGCEHGSLFSVLNHTVTKFGARLLRKWISQPLLNEQEIKCKQDVVEELQGGNLERLKKLTGRMSKMPDVERALHAAYHGKCSPLELYSLVKSLDLISKEMKELGQAKDLQSTLLREIFCEVPTLLASVPNYLSMINEKAAREKDKANLFEDDSRFPVLVKRKEEIEEVIKSINDHRREVRLLLKQPGLMYTTVQQVEFLIEVKKSNLSAVPSNWSQISSTKQVSRYHSPFIVKQYSRLNALREQLILDVNTAWLDVLREFSSEFTSFKKAIQYLATLDCLLSLAKTASQDSFCRPSIDKDHSGIEIEEGRHPIIDGLNREQDQFVPNDTSLDASSTRVMVISGPNMGGKSSYIRQVALITIMAQIGSYVPAKSARIGIVDAIYTRMGASDDLFKGQSTFMVELQEASHIMAQATDRSLVILDELGRGTSTHDGVAIAYATLQHFISQCKCLVLFVSHFPLMSEFHQLYPAEVKNYHMAFMLNDEAQDAVDTITFLYQLTEGAAQKSYGMNVAKLAEISSDILVLAAKKSKELEESVDQRVSKLLHFSKLWGSREDSAKAVVASVLSEHS